MYSKMDSQNPVYTLAQKIYKKCVIIYGETGATDKLAIRWKGQLSENSKMLAFINEIPEMNHNEIVGWTKAKEDMVVILIRDNKEKNYINISNQEVLNIGKELITAIHTPGHYFDSICFWNKDKNMIFTGDTVFIGRTGRTVSLHSDINQLYKKN